MKDFGRLMKSQLYSLLLEKKFMLIVLVALTVAGYLLTLTDSGELVFFEDNAFGIAANASMMFGLSAGIYCDFALIFVFIAVGLFASRDMDDKTMNYEIMNGHERKHIFLSRALTSVLLGTGGGLVMFVMIPLVTTLQFGWGESIPLGTAAFRIFLIALLFARLSAEMVLAASLLRRTSLVYIAGVLAFLIEAVTFQDAGGSQYVFCSTAGSEIMSFRMFTLEHIDETTELFFDSAMKPGTAAAIAVSYLVVTAGCIYFGCRLFCRADID